VTTAMSTSPCLDLRGKSITTYIAYTAWRQLAELAEGDTLELRTDTSDAIDNDLRAWCRATGHQLVVGERSAIQSRYVIRKGSAVRSGRRLAAVISDPGLEQLLSPLGFALAAALEGV
jgi:TusA-related sulfurtransferase